LTCIAKDTTNQKQTKPQMTVHKKPIFPGFLKPKKKVEKFTSQCHPPSPTAFLTTP
jgi:hypothetical protein